MTEEEVIKIIKAKVDTIKKEGNCRSVCLCGSSKFCDIIAVVKWIFEKNGILATGLHYLPEWYFKAEKLKITHHLAEHEGVDKYLDDLHLKKIDFSDCVFVVNFNGYIGKRTTYEIHYAIENYIKVWYLEDIQSNKEQKGKE